MATVDEVISNLDSIEKSIISDMIDVVLKVVYKYDRRNQYNYDFLYKRRARLANIILKVSEKQESDNIINRYRRNDGDAFG